MAKKNEKFITKQAAMMAAVSVETFLLTLNYDAMLYWNAKNNYYCVMIDYVSTNPLNELEGFIWSSESEEQLIDSINKEITLHFNY